MKKRVSTWPQYDDPEILRKVINDYFDEADASKLPYTISGLCVYIGCRRKDLLGSIPDTPINALLYQARLLIEQQHEIHLLTAKKPSGVVFALKNLGWSESSRLDLGFAGGGGSIESAKWTIEIVAPGDVPNEQLSVDEIIGLPPPPASEPAKIDAINMKPLRDENPNAPAPWFVSEFEASLTSSEEKKTKKSKKNKDGPDMGQEYMLPIKVPKRPDDMSSDRMIIDIKLRDKDSKKKKRKVEAA